MPNKHPLCFFHLFCCSLPFIFVLIFSKTISLISGFFFFFFAPFWFNKEEMPMVNRIYAIIFFAMFHFGMGFFKKIITDFLNKKK